VESRPVGTGGRRINPGQLRCEKHVGGQGRAARTLFLFSVPQARLVDAGGSSSAKMAACLFERVR
jgi:hypothetical protein